MESQANQRSWIQISSMGGPGRVWDLPCPGLRHSEFMGSAGKPGQRLDGSANQTEENHSISTNHAVGQGVDNNKNPRRWVEIENDTNSALAVR